MPKAAEVDRVIGCLDQFMCLWHAFDTRQIGIDRRLAEYGGKLDLLSCIQGLATEKGHLIIEKRLVDELSRLIAKFGGKIDAAHLGAMPPAIGWILIFSSRLIGFPLPFRLISMVYARYISFQVL